MNLSSVVGDGKFKSSTLEASGRPSVGVSEPYAPRLDLADVLPRGTVWGWLEVVGGPSR